MRLARTAALAGLLALAACGAAPATNNRAAAPGPAQDQNVMATDIYETQMPAPTMAAPRDAPDAGGPRNAFIVCPGNPRCPPAGGTRPNETP